MNGDGKTSGNCKTENNQENENFEQIEFMIFTGLAEVEYFINCQVSKCSENPLLLADPVYQYYEDILLI